MNELHENLKTITNEFRTMVNEEPVKALNVIANTIERSLIPYTVKGNPTLQILSGENGKQDFYDMVGDNMDRNNGNVNIRVQDDDTTENNKMSLGMFTETVVMDDYCFIVDMMDVIVSDVFNDESLKNLQEKDDNFSD